MADNDGLSSDLASPKVKAPLGAVFSALEDTAPNATPLPAPNLKPGVAVVEAAAAGGSSDFFSSPAAVPNLKPPEEPPNLNPEEGAVSLEVVSDETPPSRSVEEAPALTVPPPKPTSDVPNLNPADAEPEELFSKPNLNPPDPESEPEAAVVSDVPNLKPPDPESEPEVVSDVPNLKPPDPEPKAVMVPDVPNLNPPELELLEPNTEEPDVPPAAQREHRKKDATCDFSPRTGAA